MDEKGDVERVAVFMNTDEGSKVVAGSAVDCVGDSEIPSDAEAESVFTGGGGKVADKGSRTADDVEVVEDRCSERRLLALGPAAVENGSPEFDAITEDGTIVVVVWIGARRVIKIETL